MHDLAESVAELAARAVALEEAGDLRAASECARRWAEAAPADPDAVTRLVELRLALAETQVAREAVARARALGLPEAVADELEGRCRASEGEPPGSDGDEDSAPAPAAPTDADVLRFLQAFSGRENVYARQWWSERGEGGYSPVREPLDFRVARSHLLGSVTVGAYVVRVDDTAGFLAFDLDIAKRALKTALGDPREGRRLRERAAAEALRLQRELEGLGLPALLEDSGYKGRHLWVLFDAPVPAAVARQAGTLFLALHGPRERDLSVEVFPKQDATRGSIGNLIKLPLGIHRRTGRRSRFLLPDGTPTPDPHGLLRAHPRVSPEALARAIDLLRSALAGSPETTQGAPTGDGGGSDADLPAAPAPPPPPPAWTAADFDVHPEVREIFSRCGVLAAIRRRVEEHRDLGHDERVVLAHAVGHSGAGVLAVNYLLDACVGTPPEEKLQTPLSGNPVSCAKIRKRVPHLAGREVCRCRFDFAPQRYPTPRLHLESPELASVLAAKSEPAPPAWDAIDRARVLGSLWAKRDAVLAEIADLEGRLIAEIGAAGGVLDLGDGVLKVLREPGEDPRLEWSPRGTPEGSDPCRR
jgi:hypothetical protein